VWLQARERDQLRMRIEKEAACKDLVQAQAELHFRRGGGPRAGDKSASQHDTSHTSSGINASRERNEQRRAGGSPARGTATSPFRGGHRAASPTARTRSQSVESVSQSPPRSRSRSPPRAPPSPSPSPPRSVPAGSPARMARFSQPPPPPQPQQQQQQHLREEDSDGPAPALAGGRTPIQRLGTASPAAAALASDVMGASVGQESSGPGGGSSQGGAAAGGRSINIGGRMMVQGPGLDLSSLASGAPSAVRARGAGGAGAGGAGGAGSVGGVAGRPVSPAAARLQERLRAVQQQFATLRTNQSASSHAGGR
jgi:hypothetical protein